MKSKVKAWKADSDYISKLSPADKAWLTKFESEYYNGYVCKTDKSALHKTDELRKDCYTRANECRRDSYAITAANGFLSFDEVAVGQFTDQASDNPEDELIEQIDNPLLKF